MGLLLPQLWRNQSKCQEDIAKGYPERINHQMGVLDSCNCFVVIKNKVHMYECFSLLPHIHVHVYRWLIVVCLLCTTNSLVIRDVGLPLPQLQHNKIKYQEE